MEVDSKTPQTLDSSQVKTGRKSQVSYNSENLIFTVSKNSPPGISLQTPKISSWENHQQPKGSFSPDFLENRQANDYQTLLDKFVQAIPTTPDEPMTFSNHQSRQYRKMNNSNNDFMVSSSKCDNQQQFAEEFSNIFSEKQYDWDTTAPRKQRRSYSRSKSPIFRTPNQRSPYRRPRKNQKHQREFQCQSESSSEERFDFKMKRKRFLNRSRPSQKRRSSPQSNRQRNKNHRRYPQQSYQKRNHGRNNHNNRKNRYRNRQKYQNQEKYSLQKLPEKVQLEIGQPPLPPLKPYELFLKDEQKISKDTAKSQVSSIAWKKWRYEMKMFEKEAYHIRSDELKAQYKKDQASYLSNKQKVLQQFKSQSRQQRQNRPKKKKLKFKSAFKIFKLDHIAEIKEKNPTFGFKERMAILKEMWQKIGSNEKYLYVKRSRLDKQRSILKQRDDTVIQVQIDKGLIKPPPKPELVTKSQPQIPTDIPKQEEEIAVKEFVTIDSKNLEESPDQIEIPETQILIDSNDSKLKNEKEEL